MTVFKVVVMTYRILSGERKVEGRVFLLKAHNLAIPLSAVVFPASDHDTIFQFPVLHFSLPSRVFHLPILILIFPF